MPYHGTGSPVSAVPSPGYRFTGWRGMVGGVTADNPLTVTNVVCDLSPAAGFALLDSQTVALAPGWNWISFNVLPDDKSLNQWFGGILDRIEQVKAQSQSAVRSDAAWKKDLADMSGAQSGFMYKIKADAACTLNIAGARIKAGTPIQLQGGWNWTAYYPTSAMPIAQALASISAQVAEVKSRTQSATYSGGVWSGTLTQLEPGQGYTIRVSAPIVLIYPAQ